MLIKTPSSAEITNKSDLAIAQAVRLWLITASLEPNSGRHVSFVMNEEAFEQISERVCLDFPR
jgi:hypothetical protein